MATKKALQVQPLRDEHRTAVNALLKAEWNAPPAISCGRAFDTTLLPGFVVIDGDKLHGVVLYNIEDSSCEIVVLNSVVQNRGIGSALIRAVAEVAREYHCERVWLVTTNDNIDAIRFYQIKGFDWVAIHRDAIEESRRLKPSIPLIGDYGIPLRHELEFEIWLSLIN